MAKHIHVHIHTGDAFNEADHPRDGGKFTSGSGGGAKKGPTSHPHAALQPVGSQPKAGGDHRLRELKAMHGIK